MNLMKEVVNTTQEFDQVAINKLISEELESVMPSSKCSSSLYVSLSHKHEEREIRTKVNISVQFIIDNIDFNNEYNFGDSFVIENNMSEIYVRSVVKKMLSSFVQSFKDCVKADVEDLQKFLDKINADVSVKGGI